MEASIYVPSAPTCCCSPAGTFAKDKNTEKCQSCPKNTFQNLTGQKSCKPW